MFIPLHNAVPRLNYLSTYTPSHMPKVKEELDDLAVLPRRATRSSRRQRATLQRHPPSLLLLQGSVRRDLEITERTNLRSMTSIFRANPFVRGSKHIQHESNDADGPDKPCTAYAIGPHSDLPLVHVYQIAMQQSSASSNNPRRSPSPDFPHRTLSQLDLQAGDNDNYGYMSEDNKDLVLLSEPYTMEALSYPSSSSFVHLPFSPSEHHYNHLAGPSIHTLPPRPFGAPHARFDSHESDTKEAQVPQSLETVSNRYGLRSLPLPPPQIPTVSCVLPPVAPYRLSSYEEERDSFDSSISDSPYHPYQWSSRPILADPNPNAHLHFAS